MSTSSQIAEILLELGAVILRPSRSFTWASGIRSPIYCDNRLLLSEPKSREKVIKAFQKLIRDEKVTFDAIAGIATAGIPHAAILSDRLRKPMLYVRSKAKGHGKGNQIEGQVKKGSRILVIEDLVSTGQSSLQAVKALRRAGYRVNDCLAIFTYGFSTSKKAFRAHKCRLKTLSDLSTLLEVAEKKKMVNQKEGKIVREFAKRL